MVIVLAAESRKYGHSAMERMPLSLILVQRTRLGSIYVKVVVDGFGGFAGDYGGEGLGGSLLHVAEAAEVS
jgi:hypothetical protein